MKTSFCRVLLILAALAVLVLPQAAAGDTLASMTPTRCDQNGTMLAGAQEGEILLDFEQTPSDRIQNGPCSWCTENSGCSTECIDDNDNQSTCGDYGVCDACREALVEIDRQLIGQDAKEQFWSICEYKWHYLVTYQSINSSSCQTYTKCETETDTEETWDIDVYCCDELPGGCFGSSC